jgi:hypothetical protein
MGRDCCPAPEKGLSGGQRAGPDPRGNPIRGYLATFLRLQTPGSGPVERYRERLRSAGRRPGQHHRKTALESARRSPGKGAAAGRLQDAYGKHGNGLLAEQVAALLAVELHRVGCFSKKRHKAAQLGPANRSVEGDREVLVQAVARAVLVQQPKHSAVLQDHRIHPTASRCALRRS